MTLRKNCAVGLDCNPVADAPALTSLRCVRPDKSGREIKKEQKELNLQWVDECAEDSSVYRRTLDPSLVINLEEISR